MGVVKESVLGWLCVGALDLLFTRVSSLRRNSTRQIRFVGLTRLGP